MCDTSSCSMAASISAAPVGGAGADAAMVLGMPGGARSDAEERVAVALHQEGSGQPDSYRGRTVLGAGGAWPSGVAPCSARLPHTPSALLSQSQGSGDKGRPSCQP